MLPTMNSTFKENKNEVYIPNENRYRIHRIRIEFIIVMVATNLFVGWEAMKVISSIPLFVLQVNQYKSKQAMLT